MFTRRQGRVPDNIECVPVRVNAMHGRPQVGASVSGSVEQVRVGERVPRIIVTAIPAYPCEGGAADQAGQAVAAVSLGWLRHRAVSGWAQEMLAGARRASSPGLLQPVSISPLVRSR